MAASSRLARLCVFLNAVCHKKKLISITGIQSSFICDFLSPHLPGFSQRYCATYTHETAYRDQESFADEAAEAQLEKLQRQHRTVAVGQHSTEDGVEFADFPLNERLLASLKDLGYTKPFEIQYETLKHTLEERDVIGRAITGSGKTLAFSIPIVQKISQTQRVTRTRSPRALVISPTRELCNQIYKSIQELDPSVRCVALYGGASYLKQERDIARGVDVVCATPGRLNDHIERHSILLNEVQFICLDEADELLTPNFKDQIEGVLQNSPRGKQMMLFSATIPDDIKEITHRFMNNPVFVNIAQSESVSPVSIRHQCIKAPYSDHLKVVADLITQHNPERCLVFLKTKVQTGQAAVELKRMGISAEALHSDLSQSQREKILLSFRCGRCKILTATDVAARGLDIPEVDLVIQVEPPANGVDYYIHRSGRTGRAGRDGLAVLIHEGTQNDWRIIKEISRIVKLEKINPPDSSNTIETAVKSAVSQLDNVSEDLLKHTRDAAKQLDLEGEKGHHLMAAALALVVKQSLPGGYLEYRYRPEQPRRMQPPKSHVRSEFRSHSFDFKQPGHKTNFRYGYKSRGPQQDFRHKRQNRSLQWDDGFDDDMNNY